MLPQSGRSTKILFTGLSGYKREKVRDIKDIITHAHYIIYIYMYMYIIYIYMYYIVYVCICTMHYILWTSETCWNCPKPSWAAENRPESRAKSVCRLESCAVICDSKSCNLVATWRRFSTGKGGVPTMKIRLGFNHEIGRFNHEIWGFAIKIQ